ncbi:hypothetical protein FQN49_001849 [Arthroderma sp. PD_2]|nr:hypothetical protein FQN49_001849 [Arthroderma sp. PD_2]
MAANRVDDTIDYIKSATRHYNNVRDDTSLPEAVMEAGRGLLLVEGALRGARDNLGRQDLANEPKESLQACKAKSKLVQAIFEKVAEGPESTRFKSYEAAVREDGKGTVVEVLVKGMMNNVCNMAKDDALKTKMESHVKALREAIEKLSKMERSIPSEQAGGIYYNTGSGPQNIVAGPGDQNNNFGNGPQVGGDVNGGINIGWTPQTQGAGTGG